jgi:hypothetical protein
VIGLAQKMLRSEGWRCGFCVASSILKPSQSGPGEGGGRKIRRLQSLCREIYSCRCTDSGIFPKTPHRNVCRKVPRARASSPIDFSSSILTFPDCCSVMSEAPITPAGRGSTGAGWTVRRRVETSSESGVEGCKTPNRRRKHL